MVCMPVFCQEDFPERIVLFPPGWGWEWGAMGGDEEEEEEGCNSNPPRGGQPAEGKRMSHGQGECEAGWSCVGAEEDRRGQRGFGRHG